MFDNISTVSLSRFEYDRLTKDSINYQMIQKMYKALPGYQFSDYIKVLFKEESEVKMDAE